MSRSRCHDGSRPAIVSDVFRHAIRHVIGWEWTRPEMMGDDVVTGRYRLLARDLTAMEAAGSLDGERDALDALRLGLECDSWPHETYRDGRLWAHAYKMGLGWQEIDVDGRVSLERAYLDGYRPSYLETFYEDE